MASQALPQFAFFRGGIVPFNQARVSIMTHTLNYGTGCFEGIRAYWNEEEQELLVFRMREHYERLKDSMGMLLMETAYTPDQLCRITSDLLRCEGYRCDAYIRPLAYNADEIIGVRLHDLTNELAIFAIPYGRYVDNEEGCSVAFSSWRRIADNSIPARAKITGAYINSAFAKTEATLNGFDEAIVLNEDGHIAEGSAENVFLVRDGKLITPPVTENILEGITRDTLIELAREELGVETLEREIDRTEIYIADEAFLCGTGVQVAAITQVDHRPVGNGQMGPVVRNLREVYFDVVHGRLPKYRAWCTPVYNGSRSGEHPLSQAA